jgi:hypothetical protein
MTDERRYREDEIRKIFELAATNERPGLPARTDEDGLTLSELQGIGREVGIDPAQVAEAASALDIPPEVVPRRRLWGMPVSVGRIVELPRAPTDREWELLVAELRRTFGAQGSVTSSSSLREWANGNLHASVEPTETGYRLRLGTIKGNATSLNAVGAAGLAMGVASLVALGVSGGLADGIVGPLALGAMGGVALASNWIRLPRWARERERQMEYVARRAKELIDPRDGPTDPTR